MVACSARFMSSLRRERRPSCLALVTDAFGGTGGIAQYNRDFLAALAGSAIFSTVVVLPRHPGEPVELPRRITQTRPRGGRVLYAFGTMIAALRQRPAVVFCGHLHLAPLAAVIARLARARLIVQTHGIEVWRAPSRLRRLAVEATDLVLSVSRLTRAAVLAWADIPPERAVVLPNTVGDIFAPGDGSAPRAAWGLAEKTVLLTAGRLDERERYKGHDRVIAAIPELVKRGHDIFYLVIGEGTDRSRLSGIAARLGVAERVRFAGFVAPETLVDAYQMADLFVMPSAGEGFGIAFIEAMACGTPALGLAVGGACDALGDGELGTALGRDDDLAAAIDRMLTGPRACPRELADRTRARFGPGRIRLPAPPRPRTGLPPGMSERPLYGSEPVLVLEAGRAERHYWRDLWAYRELFAILAWRDVAVRYKQTVIGVAWAVVRPFLTMVIFTVVFGRLAKLPSEGAAPYPIMVFAGMLPWFLFSTILGEASSQSRR